MPVRFSDLPPGSSGLLTARPGPDLDAAGYVEREHLAYGRASSYAGPTPPSGHWRLEPVDEAAFATRVVVRRPESPGAFSGTVVVEWLNVSSGGDGAPDWTYLGDEIVRRGHAWVGVSAQYVGVEGGAAAVSMGDDPDDPDGSGGTTMPPLKAKERYTGLHHPGDAYCHGIFAEVSRALADADAGGPLADLVVDVSIAVGESQSAYALVAYVDGVHPLVRVHDGFLVHSRGGAALALGERGTGVDLRRHRDDPAVLVRDDLDEPVVVVQTETDLFTLRSVLARQPDTETLRLWEVAGTAHGDFFQIDQAEAFLGCPVPVNRGQQAYVLRAALRHLDAWARGDGPAPHAERLAVTDPDDGPPDLVRDEAGNATGGVRTPVVDAPVQTLRGDSDPGASYVCQLFGSTRPLDPAWIRERYADEQAYLDAYTAATDAAVAAGFVLPEDRGSVLAEARPDLVRDAHAVG